MSGKEKDKNQAVVLNTTNWKECLFSFNKLYFFNVMYLESLNFIAEDSAGGVQETVSQYTICHSAIILFAHVKEIIIL